MCPSGRGAREYPFTDKRILRFLPELFYFSFIFFDSCDLIYFSNHIDESLM